MKIYAIHDKGLRRNAPIGFLLCYEKANEYIVELCDDLDEWEAPLLFQKFVHEGKRTIPRAAARLWVEERVIPSGRQNIGSILKNAKLSEYNERALLDLSKGKCSQDDCYLVEIAYEDIPDDIRERMGQNVVECFVSEGQSIVCLFQDNLVRKISLQRLAEYYKELSYVIKNESLLRTVKVGVGGYSISFNQSIEIPTQVLRDAQYEVALVADDFRNFISNNVVDTTRASELMQCSRQNISYLIKAEKLNPVIKGTKENLFTVGSVERVISD